MQTGSGIPQVSLSHSKRGVLRGIHCSTYSKLVTITQGAIYDVIVDLRKDSSTFGLWCAIHVSRENRRQIFIPAGCGHAFLCLEDADMLYIQGGCFDPSTEKDINPFDPFLDIRWPKLDDVQEYILSGKDKVAPNLQEREEFDMSIGDPKKRVLIVGASGQVGGALSEASQSEHVIGTFSQNVCDGMVHFDLQAAAKDPSLADDLITMCSPHIVCICAGMTWVDGCENAGATPYLINSEGPRLLVRAAKRCGSKTVFYSTDYVFDGRREGYIFTESDQINPLNVYGRSKAAGEKAVLEEDPTCLILRTTGVFGPEKQGKNFVYQLCRSAIEGKDMLCASDNFGSPTYNRDLANMTIGLLESGEQGIFNCVGPQTLTRRDFAKLVADTLGIKGLNIRSVDSAELYENTLKARGVAANRGIHLGLDITKLKRSIPAKFQPRSIEDALLHWKQNPRGAKICFCGDMGTQI